MSGTIGLSATEVIASTSVPAFTVGSLGRVDDSDGTKLYLYVHAAEAITGAGYLCVVDSVGEAEMVDTTSSAPGAGQGMRCGAAQADVADNEWFWIQVYGRGSLRTLASAAVGTELTSSATAGAVDDATTAGLEVINGLSLGTATGGAEATNADAYFNFPYVGRTL
jgi:hypothetical protein